ncbi:MAG: hypothetical protein ACRD4M_11040, partial [Candidatus Acidiferrales bacterium]
PAPNQLASRRPAARRYPELRPLPAGEGRRTLAGTRAAVRTTIRYRNGVLTGCGASVLDGSMEDLATDRSYRLMLVQRMEHWRVSPVEDERGNAVAHTPEFLSAIFDEELEELLAHKPRQERGTPETLRVARDMAESMILNREFDPV